MTQREHDLIAAGGATTGVGSVAADSCAPAALDGILPATAVYTLLADALPLGSQEAVREASLRVSPMGPFLALLAFLAAPLKKMKISLPATTSLLLGLVAFATPIGAAGQAPPDHTAFDSILADIVEQPLVDYEELTEAKAELDAYIQRLGTTDPTVLERSSREVGLAFWINAYNACMLKIVAEHYPLGPGDAGIFGSIRNFFAGYPSNSVWQIRDVFTRPHCFVAGEERSQDQIEHEIIRPTFDEPRIHFAVNCAARSCPVLWPEAYHPDELDDQLDRAVEHLIASPEHFRLEPGSPATLHLNRVLDWYRSDFGGVDGLKRFFASYLSRADREMVLDPDTEVVFFEYDWSLNDTAR